jgi:hypothetical protein
MIYSAYPQEMSRMRVGADAIVTAQRTGLRSRRHLARQREIVVATRITGGFSVPAV